MRRDKAILHDPGVRGIDRGRDGHVDALALTRSEHEVRREVDRAGQRRLVDLLAFLVERIRTNAAAESGQRQVARIEDLDAESERICLGHTNLATWRIGVDAVNVELVLANDVEDIRVRCPNGEVTTQADRRIELEDVVAVLVGHHIVEPVEAANLDTDLEVGVRKRLARIAHDRLTGDGHRVRVRVDVPIGARRAEVLRQHDSGSHGSTQRGPLHLGRRTEGIEATARDAAECQNSALRQTLGNENLYVGAERFARGDTHEAATITDESNPGR